MDLKEAAQLGGEQDGHWYYASKARALLQCVEDKPIGQVLDVGAGTGFFARMVLRQTNATDAVCIDTGYETESRETESGKPMIFQREGSAAAADLVLLMDVLEHVDHPLTLLRSYATDARPGARFVITVPAFSWMWSAHDDFLGHKRRYTLSEIEEVVTRAGLSRIRGFYFFAAIFPAVAAVRLVQHLLPPRGVRSDLRSHMPLTNGILGSVCAAESHLAMINRAFGLTAFVVAEKPSAAIPR